MKTKKVLVLPYDPSWAEAFIVLSEHLNDVLGPLAIAIHHVGSTSVVGLAAKPILDVDVVIRDREDLDDVIERLAKAGYRHEGDLGIIGREAFRIDETPYMTHHLYVLSQDARELKRHLAFRDHLRTHPMDRDAYGAIKLKAALDHPADIDAYMADKNGIITSLYQKLGL